MMGDEDPAPFKQPSREETPVQTALPPSGYASQQALLDSMFPLPGQGQPSMGQMPPGFQGQGQGQGGQPQDNERLAREYHAKHERIAAKIQAMSTYNNCMGSSDKDFITRIQLSQLATADPYTSDFYAQVFTAVQKSRQPRPEEADGPTVVKVGQDAGFGVGGPTGNRFGQMGNKTMQKLSSQVKKLVEQRKSKQMSNGQSICFDKVHRADEQMLCKEPSVALHVPVSLLLDLFSPSLLPNQQSGCLSSTKRLVFDDNL
jgi:DNA topoisomerase 2-associated protein PAT1